MAFADLRSKTKRIWDRCVVAAPNLRMPAYFRTKRLYDEAERIAGPARSCSGTPRHGTTGKGGPFFY